LWEVEEMLDIFVGLTGKQETATKAGLNEEQFQAVGTALHTLCGQD